MYFVLPTPPRPFIATGLVQPRCVIYNLNVKNRDISAVCIKRQACQTPRSTEASSPVKSSSAFGVERVFYGKALVRIKM